MVCISAVLVSLLLQASPAASDQPEKTDQVKVVAPPIDLDIKEIKEMKTKIDKVKPVIEKDRELTNVRIRDIEYRPGIVPRIQLAHGYGTVITLPYQFDAANIALGDKGKFNVEVKGTSVILFPLQEFKTTNMVVFENGAGGELIPHHYMLTENSYGGTADLTVKVHKPKPGTIANSTDAFVKAVVNRHIPGTETYEGMYFDGREPVIKDMTVPFIRKLALSSPGLNIYMANGKFAPVGDVEWSMYPDSRTTIVATRGKSVTVRRLSDGKTFTAN